ncbi:hypothetical protein ACFL6U_32390 [Planctomycetota bacterium]
MTSDVHNRIEYPGLGFEKNKGGSVKSDNCFWTKRPIPIEPCAPMKGQVVHGRKNLRPAIGGTLRDCFTNEAKKIVPAGIKGLRIQGRISIEKKLITGWI